MNFDSIKRTLNGLLAALAIFMASPTAMAFVADTASLNGSLTGLWNNADQPGWGTAITHQYGIIFATFYTYDHAGSPTWYVASACPVSGSGCTGPLYTVTGGTNPIDVWNAPNKIVTQVGTMTFTFTDANTGTMSYSINGSNGTKTITKSVFASPPTGGGTGGANGSLTVTGSSSEPGIFSPKIMHVAVDDLNATSMSWDDSLAERSLLVFISNLSNAPGALVFFINWRDPTNYHACWFGTFPNSSEFPSSFASFGDCSGVTIDHNTRTVTFSNVILRDGREPPGPAITLNGKLPYNSYIDR